MKNPIASFLLASSAAFGLAPIAFADDAPPMHRGHGGMARAPMMELRSLDLDESQQQQVKKILDEQRDAMRSLHDQTLSKIRAVLTPEQQTKFDQQAQARAGRGPK